MEKSISNLLGIILVGQRDFGRCQIASNTPKSLWDVFGKSSLQRVLESLFDNGILNVVICCAEDEVQILQERLVHGRGMHIRYLTEFFPYGTAGCIRDSLYQNNLLDNDTQSFEQLLVIQAAMVQVPAFTQIWESHCLAESDMTVVFNQKDNQNLEVTTPSGLYLINRDALKYIAKEGYADIKETFLPALIKASKKVSSYYLTHETGCYRNIEEYKRAMQVAIISSAKVHEDKSNLTIADSAIISGPVVILDGVQIGPGAVILGPTVIGKNCTVESHAVIDSSVIWNNVNVGQAAKVHQSILTDDVHIKSNEEVISQNITKQNNSSWHRIIHKIKSPKAVALIALIIAFVFSFRWQLKELWDVWMKSPEYSCGLLVPFIAVYGLFVRRKQIFVKYESSLIIGFTILVVSQLLRLFGLCYMYSSAERLSVVVALLGLAVMIFGFKTLKKTSVIFCFLLLMIPLPNSIQQGITQPLQGYATTSAVYLLEILNYDVKPDGNVISLKSIDAKYWTTVAVAEACNGLRMITAFFVIIGMVILIIEQGAWLKWVCLLSTLPIALMCNTIRLVITAISFTLIDSQQYETLFHDWGGYAMMPLALLLVVLEIKLIKIICDDDEKTSDQKFIIGNL